ncbi:K(+)-transporting ATPase subunit C [Rummeliibacillus stabekisii]|uniref:K(+)-transporting ATPase subunit C n=1 Tax=Rummeliibacillus stabekisii TaxID=241244 RepID=UPI00371C4017
MKWLFDNARQGLLVSLVMFILCGMVYPSVITAFSQSFFPYQANGSLIEIDGKNVGSKKLGQEFTRPEYFWGRVSSINYNVYTNEDLLPEQNGAQIYNGVSSGTFNYGPSNPELKKRIETDIEKFLKANPTVKREEIPADLITASGSGLDPHISLKAAFIQIDRIEKASGISVVELKKIVKKNTENRVLGVFGEDKVNVLAANLDIYNKIIKQR